MLSGPVMAFIAAISYTVYLTHQIFSGLFHQYFLNQSPRIEDVSGFAVTLLALAATVTFSALSYLLVERPIRSLGQRLKYHATP